MLLLLKYVLSILFYFTIQCMALAVFGSLVEYIRYIACTILLKNNFQQIRHLFEEDAVPFHFECPQFHGWGGRRPYVFQYGDFCSGAELSLFNNVTVKVSTLFRFKIDIRITFDNKLCFALSSRSSRHIQHAGMTLDL